MSDKPGFEYQGRFYAMHTSGIGKDLMLIDRITGMSMSEFLEATPDRGPVQLALIATSIRHGNPDWSVERIYRLISELDIAEDLKWLGGDEDDEVVLPPPETQPTGERSSSPSNGSSPSSTQPAPSPSKTSFAAPT